MKATLIIFALLLEIAANNCKEPPTQKTATEQGPLLQRSAPAKMLLEPIFEGSPERFKQTWKDFSKDGRYRMAQPNEAAGKLFKPFYYDWSNNVLVIVTDTTQSRDDCLRLTYFKASTKGKYQLHWVRHNHDLTKSHIGNASSNLVLIEDGGESNRSSFLKWEASKKQYTCFTK